MPIAWGGTLQDSIDTLTHKLLHNRLTAVPIHAEDVLPGTFQAGTYTFPSKMRFAGTGANRNYFWDGLELALPSGLPYIDFHNSANPEEATDYVGRLQLAGADHMSMFVIGYEFKWYSDGEFDCHHIGVARDNVANLGIEVALGDVKVFGANRAFIIDDTVGVGGWYMNGDGLWIRATNDKNIYTGGVIGAGTGRWGNSSYGSANSEWSHASRFQGTDTYSFLSGDTGHTYINAKPGTSVWFRNANRSIGEITDNYDRLNLFTSADAAAWDQRVLRLHAPSRPGLTFYHTGNGVADQLCDQGPRIDCLDWSGTTGFPSGASSFVTISRRATKIAESIKSLDKQEHRAKIRQLRPVRFKRPHVTMHVDCKAQGCEICSQDGVPGQINKPFIDKNEDTDFLGFIAEEVAEHYPELINWEPSVDGDWDSEPRPGGVDLCAMTALLLTTIHDLQDRIEILEKK